MQWGLTVSSKANIDAAYYDAIAQIEHRERRIEAWDEEYAWICRKSAEWLAYSHVVTAGYRSWTRAGREEFSTPIRDAVADTVARILRSSTSGLDSFFVQRGGALGTEDPSRRSRRSFGWPRRSVPAR